MAELATIGRPYAEALFKAVGSGDASAVLAQMQALAAVAGNADMLRFADNPKVTPEQVISVITGAAKTTLDAKVGNLLRTVIDNGRLPALPEIAAQFNALVKARSGTSDAVIESAYPIEGAALADLVATLEKRFGRKLVARVEVNPSLIGGVRVVVGDEVLDTSVKARLDKMKLALTA
jgi:F-type H+-transporting ATPase subunit delta